MENGAFVNSKDGKGWTALHYALESNLVEIAEILVRYGAHIHSKDKKGVSPLSVGSLSVMTLPDDGVTACRDPASCC